MAKMVQTWHWRCNSCGMGGGGRGSEGKKDGEEIKELHEKQNPGHKVTVFRGEDVPARPGE